MLKVAVVNSTTDTLKKPRLRDRTKPGLVAFYDIRPGNGPGLFLQPRARMGHRVPNGLLNKNFYGLQVKDLYRRGSLPLTNQHCQCT